MAATGEFFRQGKSRLSLQQEEREVEAHPLLISQHILIFKLNIEVWLSLVERFVRDEEAAGSNPVTSTMLNVHNGLDRYEHSFLF